MEDRDKTKEQLIDELAALRKRVAEQEKSREGCESLGRSLKESEEKFGTLADQSPNMIFINRMGRVVYANRKCEEAMGYRREEFFSPGFDFMTLVAPEDRETVRANFIRHSKGEEIQPYEYSLLTKDGRRIESIITTKLIDYGGGRAILGIITDISALKRVEKALRESEAKYRDLYDNAPDMYHSLDKNGIITECNETEAKMLGYSKEEITGRPLADFFTGESARLFKKDFPRLNHEKGAISVEREFLRKDGTAFPASLNVFSEFDKDGGFLGTKTIARNVTEQKKTEAELLKAQKLESIGILAGGIAHDFNNILTAILGNINLAKTCLKQDDSLFERLSAAEKACESAAKLTRQLLTFSKGGEPLKKTLLLGGLLKDSAGLATRGSGVKCVFAFEEELWPVEADPGQLEQVINNLVINAVQSMPEGGLLRIAAANLGIEKESGLGLREGKYVRIAVEDRGTGIRKEHLTRIFDPYFTTKKKGNGLGLAISYSIINNHKGHIAVESRPGSGSTFYVYLPASDKPVEDGKSCEEEIIRGEGKILVMDDEKILRDVAGEILKQVGYDVSFAKNGEQAVEMYKKALTAGDPFDLVILDLTVPGGMGGSEAVKNLRAIDPAVKAIATSGYHNDPVMANFREHGFVSVIPKPYRSYDLGRTVHQVLSRPA